jgi:hypothetical protein
VAPTPDASDPARSVSDPSAPGYDPHSPYYDVTADSSSPYYVGPHVTGAQSGDAIRAEAAAEVEKQLAGKTWASEAVKESTEDKMVQALYEQKISEARQGLDSGVQLRSPGSPPTTDWSGATHEQMQTAITQNADSATVAESSEEWVSVGNELAQHQSNLADAISSSTSNWQGSGGDAARTHLANVGKWLGQTAQGATLTGRQQEIHSQTLNETQRWMAANPPVKFSVQDANAQLQTIKDPVQYAAQASADQQVYKNQQAVRAQAAKVMTSFDSTVGSAVATPAFAPPPKLPGSSGGSGSGGAPSASSPRLMSPAMTMPGGPGGANGGPGAPGGVNGPGGSGPGGSGPGGSDPGGPDGSGGPNGSKLGGPDGSGGNGGPGGSNGPGSIPPLDTGGPGPGGSSFNPGGGGGGGTPTIPPIDDTTQISGYSPPTTSGGPGGSSGNPGFTVPPIPGGGTSGGSPYSGGPGGGSNFTPPPIPDSFPPGGSPFGGGTGTSGGGSGGLGGGSGKIPTIGSLGGVNGSSIGSRLGGAGGGTTGGAGSNLGGGNASGAAAAEAEAAGRPGAGTPGAAGAAGKGGSSMGGAGGGKGGKGEEDKEYRLADYLEPEDDSLFAADEIVAPPVIGDWKNKDWK